MKRILLLLLIVIVNISFLFSQKIELNDAMSLAKKFERTSKYMQQSVILAHQTPYYYIFTNEQNSSFVIISAYKQLYPILGYSTESGFDANNIIPPLQWFLNGLSEQAEIAIADPNSTDRFREAWDNLEKFGHPEGKNVAVVSPLLTTSWDQGCYYNALCPVDINGPCSHVWAGCVATAMGQIMKYHAYPTSGTGTPSYTSDYGVLTVALDDETYNYDAMPNQLTASTDSIEVAKLLYHAGVSVSMGYGPDGSGAQSSNAALSFKNYFKYPSYVEYVSREGMEDISWGMILKTEIDAKRPVYYSGGGLPGEAGHAFVCDGYDGATHFHFNWGWSGYANGYYYLNSLTPAGNNFTNGQDIIKGVERADDDQVYCNNSTTLTAESGTIEDGSGSARYGNNSNCGWIISPSSQPASIILTVEYLALEEEIDYVIIYEGTSSSGNVIAALTGHTLPSPATYYISSPSVYIEFTSNASLRDDGFRIKYQSGNSINDVANSNLSIYPNPATDLIVVETTENINNVKIFNSLGQNVLNQNFQNQNKIKLNIEDIIPGLYIIETSLDNGLKLRKTINIQ
jgi:hypothetical protein